MVDHDPTSQRAPWAKQRILDTATELFYEEGIRLVGVDRLISASQVTKATFYKHYRSKDNLVVAYIAGRHAHDKEFLEELVRNSAGPREALVAIVGIIVAELQSADFRGCAFLNAAAEYPNADHPIRELVLEHRDWYSALVESLLAELGHPLPGEGADDFVVARDGAMSGGYAGDPIAAAGALQRATSRILDSARS
ncbi:TetR/AcrR family transcriptional regulator [Terrimesophilobacter mesophilus]|uniref:TetR/AcrR family transcriptional regulator n=1 Tax=Terrimesophilobacter mesophilus TaxID=433647 RepID=A0A4R8VFU4_9MICO|nr:TetR/AcrR family transcriptional regulator [Terrimesophilobacter mesophilus]